MALITCKDCKKGNWENIVPFLAFPPEIRRIIYTTNTIEALNRQIRKIIKTKGSFPSDDAAQELEGLTVPKETVADLERVARGEIDTDEARRNIQRRFADDQVLRR